MCGIAGYGVMHDLIAGCGRKVGLSAPLGSLSRWWHAGDRSIARKRVLLLTALQLNSRCWMPVPGGA